MTWICTACGADSEDHFEICWNCGTTRDGTEKVPLRYEDDFGSQFSRSPTADSEQPPQSAFQQNAATYRCPDCDVLMHEIRLLDHRRSWVTHPTYEVIPSHRGWYDGNFHYWGVVRGLICSKCLRIVLYGDPSPIDS